MFHFSGFSKYICDIFKNPSVNVVTALNVDHIRNKMFNPLLIGPIIISYGTYEPVWCSIGIESHNVLFYWTAQFNYSQCNGPL